MLTSPTVQFGPAGAPMSTENQALAATPYSVRFVTVPQPAWVAAGQLAVKASNLERLISRQTTPSALAWAHDALDEMRELIAMVEVSLPPMPEASA